jgi:predicted 2-oxoglutarate/Fe(II)-dependent dioxygenase YbiX/peroxiredoxin
MAGSGAPDVTRIMVTQMSAIASPTLGDPVPRFTAQSVAGLPFDLTVAAGRWIVLCFVGSLSDPRTRQIVTTLLEQSHLFEEDRLVVYGILTKPPADAAFLAGGGAVDFLADYDGAISRAYGAIEARRTVVLDPMLRAIANIPWDYPAGHDQALHALLKSLPAVDDAAGVPMTAPVLIVPRVLDRALCDFMIKLYENVGGQESGFMLDVAGKTATVVDHRLKRRTDLVVALPELREAIRSQIVRRLVPAVNCFFQFQATRMDRYIVACYDSSVGGYFHRHRDNINAGAQHRRFAVSINLNGDFDGCDLMFPEFGRKVYRAPTAGALVFSCGALHQVTPVTRGRRYAFLAFLYSEADAARREANNAKLHDSETRYSGLRDRLYPDCEAA